MSRFVVAQPGPSWSVHDVYVGWCEALEKLGQHVVQFNLDDRLAFYDHAHVDIGDPTPDGHVTFRKALDSDQAKELAVNSLAGTLWKTRPDVLLVVSGFFVPPEMLDHARRHGIRVVVLHTEQPYELERELGLAAHADLNLINDPTYLHRFAQVAPTVYCPHAYRDGFHQSGEPDPKVAADLAFVGTGFGSRRWFFENMNLDGLDVLLAGNWAGVTDESPLFKYLASGEPEKCCDQPETVRIYRSAKAGINLYRREAEDDSVVGGWSMGPREVEMAACGLFFMRDPRPEGDQVLGMLPTFTSPGDASEQLRYWLVHDDERRALADKAREAVADRTFEANARELLRLLER